VKITGNSTLTFWIVKSGGIVSTILVETNSFYSIFTAVHGMPARTGYEKAVCLSVKRVICDKTKESCAHILVLHERSFTIVL